MDYRVLWDSAGKPDTVTLMILTRAGIPGDQRTVQPDKIRRQDTGRTDADTVEWGPVPIMGRNSGRHHGHLIHPGDSRCCRRGGENCLLKETHYIQGAGGVLHVYSYHR